MYPAARLGTVREVRLSPSVEQKDGQRDHRQEDESRESEQADKHDRDGDEDDDELRRRRDPCNGANERSSMLPRPPDVEGSSHERGKDGDPPREHTCEHERRLERSDDPGDQEPAAPEARG